MCLYSVGNFICVYIWICYIFLYTCTCIPIVGEVLSRNFFNTP